MNGTIRLLHLAAQTPGSPEVRPRASGADALSRQQYFRDRRIAFDVIDPDKIAEPLANVVGAEELPEYTHVLVDGAITSEDWIGLRRRWPTARLIAGFVDLVRRDIHKGAGVRVAAKYADCVLAGRLEPAARLWARSGFRGEVIEAPFYLADDHLAGIEKSVGAKGRKRRDWVIYVTVPLPGFAALPGLIRFHQGVKNLGKRRPDWRFLTTGPQHAMNNHETYARRVKPLDAVDNVMGFAVSRAVAVMSLLGRGVIATILEAIQCKTWVLINPELFKHLPEAVRPYCVIVDVESPLGFDEALDRIGRKEWPEGDPNGELRARAHAALDRVILNDRQPLVSGATLSADTAGRRSSTVSSWSGRRGGEPSMEATFCTVLTPLHKRVAAHNYEIVRMLNEGCTINWNVVDNLVVQLNDKWSPSFLRELTSQRKKVARDVDDGYTRGEITEYVPGANVYTGLTLDQTFERFAQQLQSTSDEVDEHRRLLTKYLASYHHASALNLALGQVRTRYAVVIDPDLYVVRPGWLRDVIEHMNRHDLAVFGTPWNPRWYQKFRYFPCSHLMVIDLQKYPWRMEMLTPDLVRPGVKYVSTFWLGFANERAQGRRKAAGYVLRHALRALREDIRQRRTIEMSRDTAYRMLEEFRKRRDLRSDTAMPVCAPADGFQPPAVTAIQRWADGFLPDRWSYLPKRPGYLSRQGFDAHGYPDCRSLGWEEFLWQGEPFAFHVRGELQRQSVGRTDDILVLNRINTILRRLGRTPIVDRTVAGRI